MATLLEKAEKLGAKIGRRRLDGYAVYRVTCSACPKRHERSSNYNIRDIRPAMNDHARMHIERAKALPPA